MHKYCRRNKYTQVFLYTGYILPIHTETVIQTRARKFDFLWISRDLLVANNWSNGQDALPLLFVLPFANYAWLQWFNLFGSEKSTRKYPNLSEKNLQLALLIHTKHKGPWAQRKCVPETATNSSSITVQVYMLWCELFLGLFQYYSTGNVYNCISANINDTIWVCGDLTLRI